MSNIYTTYYGFTGTLYNQVLIGNGATTGFFPYVGAGGFGTPIGIDLSKVELDYNGGNTSPAPILPEDYQYAAMMLPLGVQFIRSGVVGDIIGNVTLRIRNI